MATHVPTYAQYAGQGTAMSACLEATPPLSLEQCALRAALLSAELLRGLTEERMITLNEHVAGPNRVLGHTLRGLGGASGQFAFVRATGQVCGNSIVVVVAAVGGGSSKSRYTRTGQHPGCSPCDSM